jgi:hypothetical protein
VPGTAQECVSDEPRLPGLAARTAVPSSLSPAGVKLSGGGRPSDYYPSQIGPPAFALPVQASPNPTEPGHRVGTNRVLTVAERGAQKGCENAGALWRPGEMDGVYFRMAHHVATCLAAPGASPVRARALIPMRVPGVSTPGRFRPRQPRSSTSLMGRKTDPLGAPGFVDGLAKAEPATRETQCHVYLAAN